MQASQSIRRRAIAMLVGAALAASLTAATMAVRHDANLAGVKGHKSTALSPLVWDGGSKYIR